MNQLLKTLFDDDKSNDWIVLDFITKNFYFFLKYVETYICYIDFRTFDFLPSHQIAEIVPYLLENLEDIYDLLPLSYFERVVGYCSNSDLQTKLKMAQFIMDKDLLQKDYLAGLKKELEDILQVDEFYQKRIKLQKENFDLHK